jgi:hypothetical protein
MGLDLKCPTCGSENTQRLTILKSQQTFTGSAGQTALAAHLRPPPKPGGFVIGFIVGAGLLAALFAVSLWERNPIPVVFSVLIWLGTGWWMRRPYERKFREWERYLDAHFFCLRCGALFKPGRELPGTTSPIKVCLSAGCARQIPREARTCPYCGLAQVPRLAKA